MYFFPVFSFTCTSGEPGFNQPCPETPTEVALQQWFNGHGSPAGLLPNQTAGFPAWYQDLDTGLVWPDPDGTGNWQSPFTPT